MADTAGGSNAPVGRVDEEVEELRADLEIALERIRELEEAAVDSGAAELQHRLAATEDRMHALEAALEASRSDTDRCREEAEGLEAQLRESERLRRDEARAREELTELASRLRVQCDRLSDELRREQSKSSEAATAGARAARDRQFQNVELDKAVIENEELREEVKALSGDLEAHMEAVAALKGQLEDAADDRAALEAALDGANARIAELAQDAAEAHAAAEAANAATEAKAVEVAGLHAQLEDAARRAAADLKAASERSAAAERSIAALQSEVRGLKGSTRVRELEEELEAGRAAITSMTAQRDELAALLEEQTAQLERMGAEMAALRAERDGKVAEAVSGRV